MPRTATRRRGWPRCAPTRGSDGSNLRSWILTIAYRKAIDHVRGRARQAVPMAEPPGRATAQVAAGLDGQAEVWVSVRSLAPKQRTAVAMRFVARCRVSRDLRGDGNQRGRRTAKRPRGLEPTAKGTTAMTDRSGATAARGRAAAARTSRTARHRLRPPTAAGLIDVAYALHESPVGELLARGDTAGPRSASPTSDSGEEARSSSSHDCVSPRVLSVPAPARRPRRELEQYFAGRRQRVRARTRLAH